MTTISVEAFAPEVHVGFGDYTYTVEDIAKKFDALRRLWNACREIENIEFVHWEPNVVVLPQIPCVVQSLRMQSPLWVELLFPGARSGAGVTAVRLFTRVLEDPRALAEWLPSFVEAWHRKWADAERARIEHSEAHRQHSRDLAGAAIPLPIGDRKLSVVVAGRSFGSGRRSQKSRR